MTRPQSAAAPLKRKTIVDRLPSIAGWITEYNVFRMLSDACIEGYREHGQRIGVIRGPDFSSTDGGLIFDPPEGFPMDMDPSDVWAWVQEHQKEHDMQIVTLDVKLTIHNRVARQIAPIFVVAPPEHTEILCILPINSYTALNANWRMENVDSHNLVQNESNKAHRMRPREPLLVSSLLAPFAVHQRHLFEALLRIKYAFKGQSPYINPSNGVCLRGWKPPMLDSSPQKLMMVSGERQRQSAGAVQQLAQVLRARPDCHMDLLFNLVHPLGCDLVLRDKASSIAYLIEHKMTTPKKRRSSTITLKPPSDWMDVKHNWHFLFHQQNHWLAIHTRRGDEHGDTTPAIRVDLDDPLAASIIASGVRSHGSLAKQRLQTKWQTLDVYEDSLQGEESKSTEPTTTEQKTVARQQSVYPYRGAKEQLRVTFCGAMNDQCYKLGKHVCIILEGNACGDAVMIRHDWTQLDAARYSASRTLPISLVDGVQSGSSNVLVLRFLPHSWPPRVPPSQIFEPARTRTIEIPLCMGQPFLYVAATGSFPSAGRKPYIDRLILLPSEHTDWSSNLGECSICDNETRVRDWKPIIQAFGEGQGKGEPGSSLVQAPFLNKHAEPLGQVYDFADGSVHDYLDRLLSDQNSPYVTSIYGPKGLLQRQWNHGAPRLKLNSGASGSSAIQHLFHRVLTTLPPGRQPWAVDDIVATYDLKIAEIMEEGNCKEKRAHDLAHKAVISDDAYGMPLRDLMALFAFQTEYTLRCDHCEDEDSCLFYIPDIAYSKKTTPMCANCHGSRKVCTFYGIANTPDLVEAIRSFESFRRHVPCNQCYEDRQECDNRAGFCERCETDGKECVREACKNGSEPGDDSHCPRDCDKAHENDGYTNVSEVPRGKGHNARLISRKHARAYKGASISGNASLG